MTATVAVFDPFAAALGLSFVPVSRETKTPYHPGWTNPDQSFTSSDFKPTDNQGARWGEPSGGHVDLDCDTEAACRIAQHVIQTGPSWGHRSKPGSHYLFHSPGTKTKQFIDPFTHKPIYEIRSTGSQSVLPPSVHPSGEPYEWERRDKPPSIEATELRANVGELAAAALLSTLWGSGPNGRHAFALEVAGFLAKNGVPETRAARVVKLVTVAAQDEEQRDRLEAVRTTYKRYSDGEEITATFAAIIGAERAGVLAKTLAGWLGLDRARFHIYTEATLLTRAAAPFLVKDLLVRGSLVALVSPPDIGKTFLALSLLLGVAAGEPLWLGHRLLVSGPVLYLMAEGGGRFKLRYLAWKQQHRVTRALPFYWIDQPVQLLDPKASLDFIKQAAPLKPVVVILDTLSRCLVGGDENSAGDMGRAIAVCDELRSRTGALVAVLHHTKKDGSVERGSSALRGAVDTILTLQEDSDERGLLTLSCERQKDAEPFAPIQLMRRVVAIEGECDDEGNPESSCVIQLATEDDVTAGIDKRQTRIQEFVRAEPGLTKTELAKRMGGRKADALNAIDALAAGGLLREECRGQGTAKRIFLVDTCLPGMGMEI